MDSGELYYDNTIFSSISISGVSAISSIISKTLLDRSIPGVISYAGILVSITWLTATDLANLGHTLYRTLYRLLPSSQVGNFLCKLIQLFR